ncbi:hypothetical protein D3C77_668560 [compost metagenome]
MRLLALDTGLVWCALGAVATVGVVEGKPVRRGLLRRGLGRFGHVVHLLEGGPDEVGRSLGLVDDMQAHQPHHFLGAHQRVGAFEPGDGGQVAPEQFGFAGQHPPGGLELDRAQLLLRHWGGRQ